MNIFGVEFYGVLEISACAWRLKMVACGRTKGSRAICGSSSAAIEAHIAGHSTLHTPPYIIRSRHSAGVAGVSHFHSCHCIKYKKQFIRSSKLFRSYLNSSHIAISQFSIKFKSGIVKFKIHANRSKSLDMR